MLEIASGICSSAIGHTMTCRPSKLQALSVLFSSPAFTSTGTPDVSVKSLCIRHIIMLWHYMLNVILMFSSIHRPTHNMTHCGSQASLKPMPNHWCPMHDATHGCLVITWTTEDAGSWITCSSWVATVVSESCVKWFVSEWIAKTCGIQTLIWKNFWRRTRHSWNNCCPLLLTSDNPNRSELKMG